MATIAIVNTTSRSDEQIIAELNDAGLISDGDNLIVIDQSDLGITDDTESQEVFKVVGDLIEQATEPQDNQPIYATFNEDGKLVSMRDTPYPVTEDEDTPALAPTYKSMQFGYDLFDAFAINLIETLDWFGYEPMPLPEEIDSDEHDVWVRPFGDNVFGYVELGEQGKIDTFVMRPDINSIYESGSADDARNMFDAMIAAGKTAINLFDIVGPFGRPVELDMQVGRESLISTYK